MQEAQNTQVVKDAYAAFLTSDSQTLLSLIDEQVVWQPVIGATRSVPNAGERRGRASVAEFFKITGENYQFSRFEPRDYVAPEVSVQEDAVHEEGDRPRPVLHVRDGARRRLHRPAGSRELRERHVSSLHSHGMLHTNGM